jgi:hypothetical protein
MCPLGEHSYTVTLPLGRRLHVCKFEVLIRSKAFRVSTPKFDKGEKPLVPWGDDLGKSWSDVKNRALEKLRALHPGSQL